MPGTSNRIGRAKYAMRSAILTWLALAPVMLVAETQPLAHSAEALRSQPPPASPKAPAQPPTKSPAPRSPTPRTPAPQSPQQPPRTIPDPTPDDANRVVQPEDLNVDNLNNPLGLAAGPQSNSPAMIGDFFGSTGAPSTVTIITQNVAPNLTIIDNTFNTGNIRVGPGNFGFANTNLFPVPFFLSTPGADSTANPPLTVGQTIGVGDPQLNINPDLTLPNPPGSSTFVISNGRAVVTAIGGTDPSGGIIPGRLGLADVFYDTRTNVLVNIPNPGGGGGVGGQKIMEGNSPMPRDRVFAFYDFFENVPLVDGGLNINRLAPGFEKTFFDRLTSFELRVPMALTLDSNITTGQTLMSHGELGNLTMACKGLLYSNGDWAFSTGMGITVPTADDASIFDPLGNQLVTIQNKSTHVMPFVGALWTPNSDWFAQTFVQVDVDTNGNPVAANVTGLGVAPIGRLQSPTFLYASTGLGYWLLRDSPGWLSGFAVLSELHLNRSLQTPDRITAGTFTVGDFSTTIELLNLTLGSTFQLNNRSYVTTAYVTPIGGGSDQQFDGQFRLMYTRRFGPNPVPAPF